MVRHGQAQRHISSKKRPSGQDYVLFIFMIAAPLFELPQVWDIYSNQAAVNVSLPTWLFFAVSNVAWIAYAVRNKLMTLIIACALYLIIEVAIVVGILIYG